MNPFVLPFTDPLATRIDLAGGKGANLALMTQRGFPVPPGLMVTSTAYRATIAAAPWLPERVAALVSDDPVRLREQAAALRAELMAVPLPACIEEPLRAALAQWPAETAFSVRSSSTLEDLASAAFAGQHDTYLNCVGANLIVDRVRACFASLWQERAIAYRARQGFDHRAAMMAVAVQTMVQAEVAGVGFTINPVSGSLEQMLVDANYGLGESVVSGESGVDQFVLAKADGRLLASAIGRKNRRVVSDAVGTREEEIPADEAQRPCLSEAQQVALAALMRGVEASYQFPQDLEWAFARGQLFLLQTRPVTTIPPRWTRDESAERFPNAITPLTWDFVANGFHKSLAHSFRLMGLPPFTGEWFALHDNYVYGNQNAVVLYAGRAPFAVRSLADLEAALPHLREQFGWVQDLPVEWSRELDHYLLRIGEFMATPLADEDLPGVWDYVLRVNALGTEYFLPNIAISLTQRLLYKVLHGLLQMATGDASQASQLFDQLLAHCETKTGVINRELYEMVAGIRGQPELAALLRSRPSRELAAQGALAPFSAFATRFAKFLRDHGHREVDFDPYHPTWLEAPWVVLDNLRLMLDAGEGESPEVRELELKIRMQQTELALLARLPVNLHYFFGELVRLARTYTSLDDIEHYQTTRLTLPLRRGLRELGHRLVRRGVLAEPMDVFFAQAAELDAAIRSDDNERWDALARAVRKAKTTYLERARRTPAWELGTAEAPPAAEGALAGLPGSPGVAEGPAYLVLSPEDFAGFPKGAVLVARTTSPAWTPLFYSACAVVTESGGPLSHGAVTAREMRIPAVMSVRGVLDAVRNGVRLRVDGAAGRVSVVE